MIYGAGLDRFRGHSENNGGSLVLRKDQSTGGLDCLDALRAIIAHSREHRADRHCAGIIRRCCDPGHTYRHPGCSASFCSASLTRMLVNSVNCRANWLVKLGGMCCTSNTAAGKSLVNPGTRRMTVAGPPVEAARTTMGKRISDGALRGAACAPAFFDGVRGKAALGREAVRTTCTFAAILSFLQRSSRMSFMSRSMPLEGLATNSIAPSSRARNVLSAPSRDSELTITIGRGLLAMIISLA